MFLHLIAGHLSWPSIGIGSDLMPSSELTYWQAFFKINPFGPRQEDLRSAYLTSLFYNANKKKGGETLTPESFFPSLSKEGTLTPEEKIARTCEGIAAVFGGIEIGAHRNG